MDGNTFYKIIDNLKWNIYTAFRNILVHRDKQIWLFGSWMGDRFADNSRYLFQYLNKDKGKYGIKKVVWVTRNTKVLEEIKSMGYEAYLIGTQESKYYHLKSGVHIICNSRSTDIDAKYSFGAKKIQLWHGNGIKACGKMTRKQKTSIKDILWDNAVKPLLLEGGWYYCYWIASSEESKRVLVNDSGALKNKIIFANSARLCKCLKLTNEEKVVIKEIEEYKNKGCRIVLYLPTFRTMNESYMEPLEIGNFDNFLVNNNIIWIEKRHFAESNLKNQRDCLKNVYYLDRNFDVNILYDYINLLVSDYSSATTDAIYKDVMTMEYCPDFEIFNNNDRGFVGDYNDYHIGNIVFESEKLEEMILKCLDEDVKYNINHNKVKKLLFDENKAEYDDIMKAILNRI